MNTGATILVIDDEVEIRVLIGRMIRRLGYGVISADTPAMALEMLQIYQEDIAGILIDATFEGMRSGVLLRTLRTFSKAPTIIMSGLGAHDAAHYVGAGTICFLGKPFGFGELQNALQLLLDRRQTRRAAQRPSTAIHRPRARRNTFQRRLSTP